MKKLPTVGGPGGHPPPTPSPRSVATLPRAWLLRSLSKIVPPQMFWLITPLPLSYISDSGVARIWQNGKLGTLNAVIRGRLCTVA